MNGLIFIKRSHKEKEAGIWGGGRPIYTKGLGNVVLNSSSVVKSNTFYSYASSTTTEELESSCCNAWLVCTHGKLLPEIKVSECHSLLVSCKSYKREMGKGWRQESWTCLNVFFFQSWVIILDPAACCGLFLIGDESPFMCLLAEPSQTWHQNSGWLDTNANLQSCRQRALLRILSLKADRSTAGPDLCLWNLITTGQAITPHLEVDPFFPPIWMCISFEVK